MRIQAVSPTSPVTLRSIATKGLLLSLLLAAGCSSPRIPKQKASGFIEASSSFKSPKVVYLPRIVAIPSDAISGSSATREGEALTIIEIASVDPVVAVMRARDKVTIEDFVSAVPGSEVIPVKPTDDSTATDSTKAGKDSVKIIRGDSAKLISDTVKKHVAKPPPPRLDEPRSSPPPAPPLAQAWVHTLRITPRPQMTQSPELAPDDGDDNPESPRVAYNSRPIGRRPGWTVAVGSREIMRILDVISYTPKNGEPPGEVLVDFLWHWRSTKAGAPFDTESAEYQSLPPEVQQAAITGAVTVNTSLPHWSRATLAHEGTGWKVTSVDWTYGDDKPHQGW